MLQDRKTCVNCGNEIGISDNGILRDQNGIYRIGELIKLTKKELEGLPLVNKELYKHIIDKVHESGLKFADEVEEPIEIGLKPLAILHLTHRPLYLLIRRGINTISKLIKYTTKDLMNIRQMGNKSFEEIIDAVHSLGLRFADEREEENTIVQNDKVEPINDTPSVSE